MREAVELGEREKTFCASRTRSQVSGRGEGLGLGAAVVCVSICQPCRPVECGVRCSILDIIASEGSEAISMAVASRALHS